MIQLLRKTVRLALFVVFMFILFVTSVIMSLFGLIDSDKDRQLFIFLGEWWK